MKIKKYKRKNIELGNLIRELKKLSNKEKVKVWKTIAKTLEKSSRRKKSVNLFKINKYTRDGETAIIPGKILSLGSIDKNIVVSAYQVSYAAKKKLGNKFVLIQDLMKKNPKGKKVRIIG